jgi:hypothetical protein
MISALALIRSHSIYMTFFNRQLISFCWSKVKICISESSIGCGDISISLLSSSIYCLVNFLMMAKTNDKASAFL